jgi:hypothetical protein
MSWLANGAALLVDGAADGVGAIDGGADSVGAAVGKSADEDEAGVVGAAAALPCPDTVVAQPAAAEATATPTAISAMLCRRDICPPDVLPNGLSALRARNSVAEGRTTREGSAGQNVPSQDFWL